jgi:tape measure domain-containing protein
MSVPVDERVVSMDFDNKRFEKNVSHSMSTLDRLKNALNFKNSERSLNSLKNTANNMNFNGLEKGIDTVRVKFDALQVMGIRALSNITDAAMRTGTRMAKALTLDPITTGFKEYETQMNAVQTILANTSSKGTTIDQVNRALDELNMYADKTIYNFTEMTRNIGTFTAAGVGLQTSVNAIKGISNLAAVSGSTAQQASTAMYQLSQALAAGTVKLQDWNSVVNAGMGGEVFQNALKETARVHGIKIDQMIKKEGSFRETLKNGWITSALLTETLSKFTGDLTEAQLKAIGYSDEQITAIIKMGETANNAATKVKTFTQLFDTLTEAAQSGWAKTWQIIIGDFEEAKELFTEVGDVLSNLINKASDARNQLLSKGLTSEWSRFADTWNSSIGDGSLGLQAFEENIKAVAREHGIAIDEMIATDGSFEKSLRRDWLTTDLVKKSMNRFTNSVSSMSEEQLKAEGYTLEHIKAMKAMNEEIQNGNVNILEFTKSTAKISGRENLIEALRNSFDALFSVIKPINEALLETFSITPDGIYKFTVAVKEFTASLTLSDSTASKVRDTFKGLFSALDIIRSLASGGIQIAFNVLRDVLGLTGDDILSFTASIGQNITGFNDWLKSTGLITKGVDRISNGIVNAIKFVFEYINAFIKLESTQKKIEVVSEFFKKSLSNIGDAIGIGSTEIENFAKTITSLNDLSLAGVEKAFGKLSTGITGHLGTVLSLFKGIGGFKQGFADMTKEGVAAAGVDYSNLEKSMGSFIDLTKLNFEAIDTGKTLTVGMSAVTALLVKRFSDLVGSGAKLLTKFTDTVSGFNATLSALSSGIKKGLSALALKIQAEGIKQIAISVAILAGSVAILALLPQEKVWSAVGAVTALAAVLGLLSAAVGLFVAKVKPDQAIKITASLGSIAGSLLLLAGALKLMGDMDVVSIVSKGSSLVLIMTALMSAMAILAKKAPTLSTNSIALVSMSAALLLLAKAMQSMEKLDANKIEETMQTLLITVGIMAAILIASRGLKIGSAATLLSVGVALSLFAKGLNTLTNTVDMNNISKNFKGFIAIFGLFGALMLATRLAGQHAVGAGVAIVAMSASLLLLTAGIKSIAAIDPETLGRAQGTILKLLGVFALIVAISKLAGGNAVKAGIMVGIIAGAITSLSVSMAILSMLDPNGLDHAVKAIATLQICFALIIAVTGLAKDAKGNILATTTAVAILAASIGLLSFIDPSNLDQVTKSMTILMGMFAVMVAASSLSRGAWAQILLLGVIIAEIAAVFYVLNGIDANKATMIADAMSKFILSMSASCILLAAAGAFIIPALAGILLLDALIVNLGIVLLGLGKLSEMFPGAEALLDKGIPILDKISAALGATSQLTQVGDNLSAFMISMQPFFTMVKDIDTTAIDGVKNLADIILMLTASDIISKVASFITGGSSLSAFGEQLQAFGTQYVSFANSVNQISDISGVNNSVAAIKALAEVGDIIPNSGGLVGIFTGENDWATFGLGLAEFGKAIKDYGTSVTGLAISEIVASIDAVRALADVGYALPNSGGLIGIFAGENNWPTFGKGLAAFGRAIKDYGTSVTGLAIPEIIASTNAVRALTEVAALIPNSGGILSWFSGDNTFEKFGKGLGSFSSALQTYAANVAGLNVEVINGSVQAVRELASITSLDFSGLANFSNAINEFLRTPIEQFVQKLQNGAKSAREQAGKIVDEIQAGMSDTAKLSDIDKELDSVMVGIVDNMKTYHDEFRKSGSFNVDGLILGMVERLNDVYNAGFSMGQAVVDGTNDALEVHSPGEKGKDSTEYHGDGMVVGAENEEQAVYNAGFVLGTSMVDGTNDAIKTGWAAFSNLMGKASNGIGTTGKTWINDLSGVLTGKDPIGVTELFSKYTGDLPKQMTKIGEEITNGMAKGLGSSGSKAKIKSALDKLKEWIDEEKYYNRLTLEQELDKWLEVQAKYASGSEERKQIDREVYRLRNEIIKDTYDKEKKYIEDEVFWERATLNDQLTYWIGLQEKYNALGEEYATQREETNRKVFELQRQTAADAYSQEKQWIDDKKYYNQMSLDEELGYWKGIQRQFLAGSKERIDADKEVYRVQQELAKEAYNNATKWIDDRLYYEEMNLSEELYTWEHLQDMYEEGSEERMKADREVFRLNKEINAAREEYDRSVADLEEETTQKRIDLEQEYYDKTKEVNDKLAADIEALNKQYDDAVKQRADSIYSAYNLFDYAKEGGNVEGSVLLTNLGSQVTALEDWQKEINSLGDRGIAEGLLDELRAMGPSSMAEIKAINSLTDEQLTQYVNLWQQKHELAKNQAIFELNDLKMETTTKIEEIKEAARIELESYKNTWDTELAALNANAEARLEELRVAFDEKIGTVSSETKRTVRNLTRDIEDAIDVSATEIEDRTTDMAKNIQTAMETPDWVSIGTNIIAGITKGIQDKAGELAAAAAKAARDALEAAEAELDINSPSGKFEWVGLQCIRGMVLGFSKNSALVMNEASAVGSSVVNSINGAISKIAEGVQYGFDPNPTIRPVVDLSNVSTGLSQIRAMFSREQALIVGVNTPQTNNKQNQNGVNNPNKGTPQPQFIQNNYSPKALSRTEIYRQTKNQFSAFERMVNT